MADGVYTGVRAGHGPAASGPDRDRHGGRRRYRWGDAKYMTGQTLMADGGANKLY